MDLPEAYEQRLLERLRRRDEAAFNELVRLYQARVFSVVVRMIGDRAEAEDIAQEVFIAIFKSIESFRGESKFSTWIFRIATNHCRNRIKYLGRRARGSHDEFDAVASRSALDSATQTTSLISRPDTLLEESRMFSLVQRALETLDEEHRELVVLRDVEGLPYEEIQEITGLAEGTVKSRLHRARVALKASVERLQGEKR